LVRARYFRRSELTLSAGRDDGYTGSGEFARPEPSPRSTTPTGLVRGGLVTVCRGVVTIGPVFRERQSPRKAFQHNNIGLSVTVVTLVTVSSSYHDKGTACSEEDKPVDLSPR